MIKQMIRVSCRPIQTFFDAIRHRRCHGKMMSHVLKINRKFNYCAAIKG
jgi:hypothetical protein